jgi:hypothetical protein
VAGVPPAASSAPPLRVADGDAEIALTHGWWSRLTRDGLSFAVLACSTRCCPAAPSAAGMPVGTLRVVARIGS